MVINGAVVDAVVKALVVVIALACETSAAPHKWEGEVGKVKGVTRGCDNQSLSSPD